MSYPPTRSMNDSLSEGATDGKYKKVIQDRDGAVEAATYADRADLDDYYHGIHEKQPKVRPDGRIVATPNYVPTRPASGIY